MLRHAKPNLAVFGCEILCNACFLGFSFERHDYQYDFIKPRRARSCINAEQNFSVYGTAGHGTARCGSTYKTTLRRAIEGDYHLWQPELSL